MRGVVIAELKGEYKKTTFLIDVFRVKGEMGAEDKVMMSSLPILI